MNKATLRKELMELTPAEQLEFMEELWDSLEPENLPELTDGANCRRSSADMRPRFKRIPPSG